MGAVDFNKLSDFDLAQFTGVIPDVSGAVMLEPNNYIPEQFLRTLDNDGAPQGWSKVSGPTADGYHAYLFMVSGNVRTGGRQTFTPDKTEDASHLFNKPLASGGLAPTASTPGVAIPAEPLEAPVVTKTATGVSGFQQGEYMGAISYVDKGGNHTLTTNPVPFTINTDGKLVEFHLLLDADRTTVSGQGLWLTEPVAVGGTPDVNTLRLQDVAPNTGRAYTIKGPYNFSGRLAPTRNETELGTPPRLERPRDYDAVSPTPKWIEPGYYMFYIVQTTALGDSMVSKPSVKVERKVSKQQGIQFHPQLPASAIGYKIFWQDFYEATSPPIYQLIRTHSGDRARPFKPTDKPFFYGNKESGDITERNPGAYTGDPRAFTVSTITDRVTLSSGAFKNGQEIRFNGNNLPAPLKEGRSYWVKDYSSGTFKVAPTKDGRAINITGTGSGTMRVFTYEFVNPPETFGTISIQGDPPTEDASGIPNPTGDIDAPVAVGLGIPAAGTYLAGYTRVLGGQETPISDMVSITLSAGDVTAGMVIKMDYPPRVNKIPNALYGQVDQKGMPMNWETRNSTNVLATAPVASQIGFESAGLYFLQTSGSLANTGRYPSAQTAAGYEIALDRARLETIAGWLAVSSRISGSAYIEVVQLNGSRVEVGTRLTLATLAVNGAIPFAKTIGDSTLSPDLSLHAEAVYAIIQWGTEGNPRQLRVKAYSQIWAPQRGVGRRYLSPPNPTDAWVATNDPSATWPSSHLLAIGQPPPTAASLAALASTITTLQPDYIEGTTFATGTMPSGWTTHRNPVDANTEIAVITAAAIEGTYGLRSRDGLTTTEPDVFIDKSFDRFTIGSDIALRSLVRLTAIPTQANTYSQIMGITSANPDLSDPVGLVIYRDSSRAYLMAYRWHLGTWYEQRLITSPTNGTVLDIELKVTGLGGLYGKVEVWVGQGGAARTLRWTTSNIKYANDMFDTIVPFLGTESGMGYPAVTSTYDYDSVHLTSSGYIGEITLVSAAPALTPLVQPDWPWLAGTTLNGPNSSPVDYTYTTSNNDTLGVAATFNRTGAVAAERTLAQIRTSGGTELVGLYMKTDHTVELRKGATPFSASAAVPTGTDYRFDVIVSGAGTANGVALVYRTIGTGSRELIVLAQTLDFTTTQAQRATVANNAELTETNIVVSVAGEYVYDNAGPDGQPINQGYVSIVPADVTTDDIGFVVDEFIVKPAVQRTAAVYMRTEDLPADAAPFTIVAYDAVGRSVELGSIYADGTAVANSSPGWAEYWLTYTPPDGFARIRIEHRGITSGRYVFQKPLDAPGNLNSTALRAAARNDGRALEGTYFVVLNARVPGRTGTMVGTDYREARTGLVADADLPIGDEYTFTADATTNILTLSADHFYKVDSRVQLSTTDTLPAPLALDTTYYARDITTTTLKLSATEGGAAIDLTTAGTGTHTIYGATLVSARWRAAGGEELLSGATWQADPDNVPDLEWVEAEVTLEGDGTESPIVVAGNPRTVFLPWMPMLLHGDGTPLYGGVYIGGGGQANNLFPPFWRSLYDTEAVGGRAAPRALTDAVGGLFGFTLNVLRPEALAEIYSNRFLDEDYMIISPFHDLIMRVRFYDPPEEPTAMFEYEGFDESRPFAVSQFMPMVVAVERAEVVESAVMSGEAPGATELTP